jgi:uncharacterized protein YggE
VEGRDVRASDVSLAEEYGGYNETRRLVGFRASITFHTLVRDFGIVEPLLIAVVDEGADRVYSVHNKTSRIKELRATARTRALEAARLKAEQYAAAAKVRLGAVVHVEDVNPDEISRRSHLPDVDLSAEEHDTEAHNPGSITIAGAVLACFAIAP